MAMQSEQMWVRQLMPLPQEVHIERDLVLRPDDIAIAGPRGDDGPASHATALVESLLRDRTGRVPNGSVFTVRLAIAAAEGRADGVSASVVARLKSLPNNDQAYVVEPTGDASLQLTALHGKGLYYAAATLVQLLGPHLTRDRIALPLAQIVDWPDLEERGLWNFPDPPAWIPWLASLKLNYGKMATTQIRAIERGKSNALSLDRPLMATARSMGFNYLPYLMHFNFLHDYGLFRAYPELAGIGDTALSGRYRAHKSGNQHRVPCASRPQFTALVREWLQSAAEQGAGEVSCWLSERPAQCGCRDCTAIGQFVLEARACVAAWRGVAQAHPGFTIRLFLSTTTSERYWRVVAETPPQVRLERCCNTWMERVTHSPRDLYVDALFDRAAAEGRWVASYDVPLGSYGRVDTPEFKIPCSSAPRIRDYVAQLAGRRYRGAYGMIAWSGLGRETYGYNISALAEWSWNLHGRDEREFAAAWAAREGYANPEAVADWAELMGPVEFDVFESEFPVAYSWGQAVRMVEERRRPYLGEGMYRYFAEVADFARKLEACDRALAIAQALERPQLAHETLVVRSYVELAWRVYAVAEQVATDTMATLASQVVLRAALEELQRAGAANVAAIRAWRAALSSEPWHVRVHDAIAGTETTVAAIVDVVEGRYLF
jgi:hypothetical protein